MPCRKADSVVCPVCYGEVGPTPMIKRPCCQHQLCRSCFTTYLSCKVTMGVTRIPCPLYPCSSYVKDHEVFANLISGQHKQLYHKLLVDKANDPTLKTCPRCGQDFQVQVEALQGWGVARNGLAVTCQACDLRWCFTCQAPLHEGVTCRERRQGDQEFQAWVQRRDANNNANAQKCPGCGTYIQRSSGCNSMICIRCNTSFCYDCGGSTTPFKNLVARYFLGNHNDRLSPFGCSRRLLPEFGAGRMAVKASVFGLKALAVPLVFFTGVGLLAVALPLGAAALLGVATYRVTITLSQRLAAERKKYLQRRLKEKREQARAGGQGRNAAKGTVRSRQNDGHQREDRASVTQPVAARCNRRDRKKQRSRAGPVSVP